MRPTYHVPLNDTTLATLDDLYKSYGYWVYNTNLSDVTIQPHPSTLP